MIPVITLMIGGFLISSALLGYALNGWPLLPVIPGLQHTVEWAYGNFPALIVIGSFFLGFGMTGSWRLSMLAALFVFIIGTVGGFIHVF